MQNQSLSPQEIQDIIQQLEEPQMPIEEVETIYQKYKHNQQIVGQVAMNLSLRTSVYDKELGKSDTMISLLTQIANSEDMGARWAVAKNPHTPVDILKKLAKDEINLVRALVATNPNTPPNILQNFFSDEKIVRDGLSGNPSTPVKLLTTLADDTDKMVRLRLAENPSATASILEKLQNDSDADVAKAAQIHLKKLA